MVYCVVPEPLTDELYVRMEHHYADDPNVQVIVDRRRGERRSRGWTHAGVGGGQRRLRDRRRARVPGELPRTDAF